MVGFWILLDLHFGARWGMVLDCERRRNGHGWPIRGVLIEDRGSSSLRRWSRESPRTFIFHWQAGALTREYPSPLRGAYRFTGAAALRG